MENQLKILDELLNGTIDRYKSMFEKFHPCQPDKGEFLEQNLITNFAIEFATRHKEANIYTEIPFMCDDENKNKELWKCRADLFIINGNKGYVIEAKGSQRQEDLIELITKDICRIKTVKKSFSKMKKSKDNFLTELYGVIIADFWGLKKQKTNPSANEFIRMWNENDFKDNDELKRIEKLEAKYVDAPSLGYPYWLLAGIFKLDWNFDEIC